MASSYSADLKLELMATGEKSGLWGDITNTNLNILQQAIAGYEAISIAGGVQTTALTFSNGLVSNGKNAVIKLTGTITGNQTVTIPDSIEKTYIIENGTTGAFTVQFKTVSGTGPTWSTTDKGIKILFSDGTNVVDVNANLSASSFEQINLPTQNELRFEDASGGQYVALKAGTTVASNVTFTLPTADGTSGQALTTNGSGVLSFATAAVNGAVNWNTTKITADPNPAVSGVGYFADTTSAAFTITLPSSPAAGAVVGIADYANTFATNNLTVGRNSSNIGGVADDAVLSTNGVSITFVYVDATQGWIVTDSGNRSDLPVPQYVAATGGTITTCGNCKIHTFTGPGTFTVTSTATNPANNVVSYMVVAGGGSGGTGYQSGGGGAGGFREYKSPVTPYTASPLDGNPGGTSITVTSTSFPITVGGGGSSPIVNCQAGNPGSNSVFSTITSTAGGGGGSHTSPPGPENAGKNGGSGGGAGRTNVSNSGGSGNTPPVSPSQGSDGGDTTTPYGFPYSGGGGGGATAQGTNTGGSTVGPGGAGATTSISGSPTAYAGGGGGGGYANPAPASTPADTGAGGTGGGGNGAVGTVTAAQAGTANTGGGGGGSAHVTAPTNIGGSGGSGIVVIRYKFQ
jgi:hypothetical protein